MRMMLFLVATFKHETNLLLSIDANNFNAHLFTFQMRRIRGIMSLNSFLEQYYTAILCFSKVSVTATKRQKTYESFT